MIRRLIVPLAVAAFSLQAGSALAQGAFPAPLPAGVSPPQESSSPANGGTKSDSPFPPVNGAPRSASPFPPVNSAARSNSPFPPVNSSVPQATIGTPNAFPSQGAPPVAGGAFGPPQQQAGNDECMKGFLPLRQEAERRGSLIKKASDRRAPPSEACKLIGNFSAAEVKMIKYVEANAKRCGIPDQIHQQLVAGHKNTAKLEKQVCNVAQQQAQQPRGPAAPSLSEVLGSTATLPEARKTKHGGSTFDTLSGNVLTR